MSQTAAKPTIVLIQGAFQLPDVYYKLADALRDYGYPIVQPPLPSLTGHDEPDFILKSLEDDARVVRSEIRKLVDEGKQVFVKIERAPWKLIMSKGQSVLNTYGVPPNHTVEPDGRFIVENTAEILYHDLPDDEAKDWASKTLHQAPKALDFPLTNEAYRNVPTSYMICERDRGLNGDFQRMFAASAGSNILSMDCGHSPMLSHTSEFVEMIDGVVKSAVGGSI
ncbi:hypothetical protein KJ359_001166 [Pestalotiopsis sp. 9143b]|nr:hypothetical protein KJ359_001166 [Pestalotiopsis sp. 9143b]